MTPAALYKHMTLSERSQAHGSAFAISSINALVREAYSLRASDLHLDPGSDSLIARLRIDGILYDKHHLPIIQHSELIARLKVLAGLRTDEHQSPQDGRFRFTISAAAQIDVRISIVPTHHGENAVLRLLSSRKDLETLGSLGLQPTQESMVRHAATRPHGMIIMTGPTGSGKTSTLYSLIHLLNTRNSSIITIEDPVEYTIPGISQLSAQQDSGLSFATGLRSILRQDPNIIGVGEIRDRETAAIATNAALTGHLVLSTLHTTDAPTALPRLMDMGIEPYLISSTVSLVISQRLIRRLCRNCRTKRVLQEEHKKILSKLSVSLPVPTARYESRGCSTCSGRGAFDRIGIFEVMPIDAVLREAIERRASAREIRTLALSQGMISLVEDGLQKAAKGIVSLTDVVRLISI